MLMTEHPAEKLTTRQVLAVDAALLVLTIAAAASSAAGAGLPRTLLVLVAALVVPGWAVLTRLPHADVLTSVALTVVISVAIEILGSLALGWAGWWHPWVLGVGLAGLSGLSIAHDLADRIGVLRRVA
jgi:uncharacterized membrane protein